MADLFRELSFLSIFGDLHDTCILVSSPRTPYRSPPSHETTVWAISAPVRRMRSPPASDLLGGGREASLQKLAGRLVAPVACALAGACSARAPTCIATYVWNSHETRSVRCP